MWANVAYTAETEVKDTLLSLVVVNYPLPLLHIVEARGVMSALMSRCTSSLSLLKLPVNLLYSFIRVKHSHCDVCCEENWPQSFFIDKKFSVSFQSDVLSDGVISDQ